MIKKLCSWLWDVFTGLLIILVATTGAVLVFWALMELTCWLEVKP